MVVWSIRLCISIVFGPWPRRYKYYARCPPDWTVQWWLRWSRTATWPGRKGDWSCLCHPGWRWHGWSRSTSPSAGVQDGGRDMTWTETMEVRDRGSTFNPLFISFFSSQVKWKLLYYSAFLLQKINRHHSASYRLFFQSYLETVWRLYDMFSWRLYVWMCMIYEIFWL